MSVESQTALTEDATGAVLSHLSPPGRGKTSSSPPSTVPTAFMASVLSAQLPAPLQLEGDLSETVEIEASKALQLKDGLQPQKQAQKLRKRRYSMNASFKHPGYSKRRWRSNSDCEHVLPSNFLLGGNIFDPLNLNSLLDEEVNKELNAETPKNSPLPDKNREPVEILIPRDITDPLNLSGRRGGAYVSPLKNRRRHRNRHHGGPNGGQLDPPDSDKSKGPRDEGPSVPEPSTESPIAFMFPPAEVSPQPYEIKTIINCREDVVLPTLPFKHRKRRRKSRTDHLLLTPSPSVKASSSERGRSQAFHTPIVGGALGSHRAVSRQVSQNQSQRKLNRNFHFGTFSHHYGYQTPGLNRDPRLAVFRPEWFKGKKVLDVGCNVGHVTLAIAKHWSPVHILGLDIDGRLVHAARQNLRHFLSELHRQERPGEVRERLDSQDVTHNAERSETGPVPLMKLNLEPRKPFPVSFRLCLGPITAPPLQPHQPEVFPDNVSFLEGNYVPESEEAVMSQRAEYDVILCLSVTKWVHLNWGDLGLQWFFRRVFKHLKPGGMLILEPHPWSSYSKSKRQTETTFRNYNTIRIRPDKFSSYLTSKVGFSSYEVLCPPNSCPKGLQRPVYLFHKGPASGRTGGAAGGASSQQMC